jgi:hypothetical protein
VVKRATAAKAAVAQSNANRVAAEPAIAGPNQNGARTLGCIAARGFFSWGGASGMAGDRARGFCPPKAIRKPSLRFSSHAMRPSSGCLTEEPAAQRRKSSLT